MNSTLAQSYFDSRKDAILSILKELPHNQNDIAYLASTARRSYGVNITCEEAAFFAGLLVSEGKASVDVSYYKESGGYLLFQYEEQPPKLVSPPEPTYEQELDRVVLSFLRLYAGVEWVAGDIAACITVGGYGKPERVEVRKALDRLQESGNVLRVLNDDSISFKAI